MTEVTVGSNADATIGRSELVRIVESTSEGCAERNRVKLRRVAETTDAFAVGWFHCDGVLCPARQARYRSQRFQEAFDREMAALFGRQFEEPFVVRVRQRSL